MSDSLMDLPASIAWAPGARSDIAVDTVEVVTRHDQREFIWVPYRLYQHDPRWIPPLLHEEAHRWSPHHNPSLATRPFVRFLAKRRGNVVGRIAAIVDSEFAARWEPGAGFFGFFECENRSDTAARLFDVAARWLAARGCTRLIGPINLTTHDETGILVDGFDRPPMVQCPWNPPYYHSLLERGGFSAWREYHSYLGNLVDEPSPAVQRLAASCGAGRGVAKGVTVRALDLARWDQGLSILFALYNASFEGVWGFVPMSWNEFSARARQFRPFVRPDLVLIAEADGVPVGFSLTLPDVNAAIQPLRGRLLPFGWIRLLWRLPRVRRARFILLGVQPGRTGRGIGALLALATQRRCRALGIERLELSLVQATNVRVQRVIEAFSSGISCTYRLYQKPLPPRAGALGGAAS